MPGPPCGNNPHFQMTPGDRAAVDEFRAYLAARNQEPTMPETPVPPNVVRRRKKPVEVDTLQWTGTNEADLIAFTDHHFEAVPPEGRVEDLEITAQVFDVLHSTWVGVYTGQHIVRGVKGEFYPIAEDVLAETHEPVDGPS